MQLADKLSLEPTLFKSTQLMDSGQRKKMLEIIKSKLNI